MMPYSGPRCASVFAHLVASGWTDALRKLHPVNVSTPFGITFRDAYARDAGLRIDHLLLSPSAPRVWSAQASIVKFAVGKKPAIMRPPGWKSQIADSR